MMDKTTSKLINIIIKTIAITHGVKKIILFGSRARGDAEPKSDFDIAIICPDITTQEWLEMIERVEQIDTLFDIELVRFDTASDDLKNRILEEGVVLYERD